MVDHVLNREVIINAVKEELVGPFPQGDEIDTSKPIKFDKNDLWFGPWREMGTGEEILLRDSPTKRYGIGVLYPYGTSSETNVAETGPDAVGLIGQLQIDEQENEINQTNGGEEIEKNLEKAREKVGRLREDTGQTDLDLSLANSYSPSSMGISFFGGNNK